MNRMKTRCPYFKCEQQPALRRISKRVPTPAEEPVLEIKDIAAGRAGKDLHEIGLQKEWLAGR